MGSKAEPSWYPFSLRCSLGLFWPPSPWHRSLPGWLTLLALVCSLVLFAVSLQVDHQRLWVKLYARAHFCPHAHDESLVPSEALSCCRGAPEPPALPRWMLMADLGTSVRCRGCFPRAAPSPNPPGAWSRWLQDPTVIMNLSCPLFSPS